MLEKSMNQELLSINNEFSYKVGISYDNNIHDLSERGCQETIPEINLANGNAMVILRLLGISTAGGDAYSGKMSLEELRKKIESVSKEQMQSEITPSGYLSDHAEIDMSQGVVEVDDADKWKGDPIQDEPPTSGVKVYQPGRDENYIDNRLQNLYEIVHYGLKNGFKYLVWG